MIRMYVEIAKKVFQNNIVYRLDYFAGLINALIVILVNISIWKAIYEEEEVLGGIQFRYVITYLILGVLLQTIFMMDEYLIEGKVNSGLVSMDLLKPMNFKAYILSHNIGVLMFRLIMQFTPALIVSMFAFGLLPPFSLLYMFYFIVSVVLGYLVLYNLNFIIWMTSFWFYKTFSLVTIKDAAVTILSGALIPIWFLPEKLVNFIELTPFGSIYYIPISIYLGQVPPNDIILSLIKQAFWIVTLFLLGHILWKSAAKKLVVQGG